MRREIPYGDFCRCDDCMEVECSHPESKCVPDSDYPGLFTCWECFTERVRVGEPGQVPREDVEECCDECGMEYCECGERDL
jgi:hypothetical protein